MGQVWGYTQAKTSHQFKGFEFDLETVLPEATIQ